MRLPLPDAESVPDTVILTIAATAQVLVCLAIRRGAEEIGARTRAVGSNGST